MMLNHHALKCIIFILVVSLGGYDLLGRTKDQIRTTEQVNAALTACKDLKLDGLVIIGGTMDVAILNVGNWHTYF